MADQEEAVQSERFIDIERVIAGKNPGLLKIIPGFMIRYLKRILHQDQLNDALFRHRHKMGFDFVEAILDELKVKVVVNGEENLRSAGRFVAVSNHPLGGLDGMALMLAVGRVRKDFLFPINDFLMHLPNLRPLFIPVNKHGSNAENIGKFNDAFESGNAILYFPAGLCSRKINGNIIDLEWKKTFLSKARRYNRDILPVHISGRNSNFFYNLANLRKWLRLKVNIEMLYLVDEMFRQSNREIRITFGKTIPVKVFDQRMNDNAWAAKVREHVYKLQSNPEAGFDNE